MELAINAFQQRMYDLNQKAREGNAVLSRAISLPIVVLDVQCENVKSVALFFVEFFRMVANLKSLGEDHGEKSFLHLKNCAILTDKILLGNPSRQLLQLCSVMQDPSKIQPVSRLRICFDKPLLPKSCISEFQKSLYDDVRLTAKNHSVASRLLASFTVVLDGQLENAKMISWIFSSVTDFASRDVLSSDAYVDLLKKVSLAFLNILVLNPAKQLIALYVAIRNPLKAKSLSCIRVGYYPQTDVKQGQEVPFEEEPSDLEEGGVGATEKQKRYRGKHYSVPNFDGLGVGLVPPNKLEDQVSEDSSSF